jgi:hypothetical protein
MNGYYYCHYIPYVLLDGYRNSTLTVSKRNKKQINEGSIEQENEGSQVYDDAMIYYIS